MRRDSIYREDGSHKTQAEFLAGFAERQRQWRAIIATAPNREGMERMYQDTENQQHWSGNYETLTPTNNWHVKLQGEVEILRAGDRSVIVAAS